MEKTNINKLIDETVPQRGKNGPLEDYRKSLEQHNLKYKLVDHYFYVGEVSWTQGWILDIAIITMQLSEALESILPLLIKWNAPFRLVNSIGKARSILNGHMGYLELGKVISIYPPPEILIALAKELIIYTQNYRGPRILTDAHLGAVVFTRYGASNRIERIDENGVSRNYIRDAEENLMEDPFDIPFKLRKGLTWPFHEIVNFHSFKHQTVLQDKYRPMAVLKNDAKGKVRKGLWLKKLYHLKWVIIKEGKQCMISDSFGRDISDRLHWQYEIHKDLEGKLQIPKVHDIFTENGDTYLVMEHIKGPSFENIISQTLQDRTWDQLSLHDRNKLLGHCVDILNIINRMHENAYIHRDITPNNFLIHKTKGAWMIDLELAYSVKLQKPAPPFRLGTPGYISPEQFRTKTPTNQQDVYAIGGLIISTLTGLLPGGFATNDLSILKDQLQFFINDTTLIEILVRCFHREPSSRPTILELVAALQQLKRNQSQVTGKEAHTFSSVDKVKNIIHRSLKSLSTPAMLNNDGLWFAKAAQLDGFLYEQDESLTVNGALHSGLSGVIFTFAQAQRAGFSTEGSKTRIENGISFIRQNYLWQRTNKPSGLFNGTAGIGLTLLNGLECELFTPDIAPWNEVKAYLTYKNTDELGLATGLAGQGMALIKAISITEDADYKKLLEQYIETILLAQQNDGSWFCTDNTNHIFQKYTGLGHGTAGIACFLLEFLRLFGSTSLMLNGIKKALSWLASQAKIRNHKVTWPISYKSKISIRCLEDGNTGIAYCFLKAYSILGSPHYLELAQMALRKNDFFEVGRDITQANGLVGLGEVYLEAAKILQNDEWRQRASWIASYVTHYFHIQEDGSSFWITDGTGLSTPGLMVGNSGVVHFLLRYVSPNLFAHPLLP